MSIQIEVPLDMLKRPTVARALSDLMWLLGAHQVLPPEPPAPADSINPGQQEVPTAPPAASAPSEVPEAVQAQDLTPEQALRDRFEAFKRSLSNVKIAMIFTLLESRGRMTVADLVKDLQLDSSKSLGGLIGAAKLWIRRYNLRFPIEKQKGGEWKWTGLRNAA